MCYLCPDPCLRPPTSPSHLVPFVANSFILHNFDFILFCFHPPSDIFPRLLHFSEFNNHQFVSHPQPVHLLECRRDDGEFSLRHSVECLPSNFLYDDLLN